MAKDTAQIGETRERAGGTYKKVAEGKWVRWAQGRAEGSVEKLRGARKDTVGGGQKGGASKDGKWSPEQHVQHIGKLIEKGSLADASRAVGNLDRVHLMSSGADKKAYREAAVKMHDRIATALERHGGKDLKHEDGTLFVGNAEGHRQRMADMKPRGRGAKSDPTEGFVRGLGRAIDSTHASGSIERNAPANARMDSKEYDAAIANRRAFRDGDRSRATGEFHGAVTPVERGRRLAEQRSKDATAQLRKQEARTVMRAEAATRSASDTPSPEAHQRAHELHTLAARAKADRNDIEGAEYHRKKASEHKEASGPAKRQTAGSTRTGEDGNGGWNKRPPSSRRASASMDLASKNFGPPRR